MRIALCFLCSVAQVGVADEVSSTYRYTDVIVVSGVYHARRDFDLPFAIDRIDATAIHDGQAGINLSESLARVPGIVVQNRQNYAQDLQISSRGFGARAAFGVRGIKLIADGIPASTPDGQGQAATFNLDVADHIEMLRGPAATLYGSNAGGVLQLFSRDGAGPLRVTVDEARGSDNLNKWQFSAEGGADNMGLLLNTSRLTTDGYRDHSDAQRDQTFAKFTFIADADSRASIVYNGLEQNNTDDPLGQTWAGYRAKPRSVVAAALIYNTRKSIDHQQLGANYERNIGAGTMQLTLYGGKRNVQQFLAIPKGVPSNETGDGGVVDFERTFGGAGMRWLQSTPLLSGELHGTAGVDFNRSSDDRLGFQNYVGPSLGVKGALRRDERDSASSLEPYLQADWTLQRWTFAGGIRRSWFRNDVDDFYLSNGDDSGSERDSATTGSLGVSYALTPVINTYFNIGRGYETPTLTEQAYALGDARGFNRGLQGASSTQFEGGAKMIIGRNARINLAVFQIDTDNEIVVAAASGGRTSYQNAGATRRRGVELGIDSQFNENWSASFSYTYLNAVYADAFTASSRLIDSGNRLPGVPTQSAFAEIAWQPHAGINTAFEAIYRDTVQVEDANIAKAAPAYTVLDWRAHWTQNLGQWVLQQTLRVDNLFDRQYVGSVIVNDANARYYEAAPGRTWYAALGASYRFN
ncbi:MAG: TonB-dependent receptor [Verrucomicrobiaceae bacterium]|nr:TonB-dependent receptor [Verrucomicrobiaceae bacterium]